MRTLQTTVFKFSELSDTAKEKAISDFDPDPDYVYTEAMASAKAFCDLFPVRITNYSLGLNNSYIDSRFTGDDGDIANLSGQRLATYIWNNYRYLIWKGKYYGKLVNTNPDGSSIEVSKDHPAGLRHVKRYSRCQIESSQCPFTGVVYDAVLLDPIHKFLKSPDGTTFEDLLESCLSGLASSVQSEIEYRYSSEAITEDIEANEYEFTETGEMI